MTLPPLFPLTGDIKAFDSIIWINRFIIFGHCVLEWEGVCVGKVYFNPKSCLCNSNLVASSCHMNATKYPKLL